MTYPKDFISLVGKVGSETNDSLKFIGQGNPNANILFVGKDCNIDLTSTRGQGCYEMEYLHNAAQWETNIANKTDALDVPQWSIGEDNYNPLYPYRGQKNNKAERTELGEVMNGGASSTWCAWQKLSDKLFHNDSQSIEIDFHQFAFLTVFSSIPSPINVFSMEVEQSVKARCKTLFSSSYFRSFPIVILACGRFAKDYNIDIEHVFGLSYQHIEQEGDDWMRIFEHEGRLLIHTRPIKLCSDKLLDKIAEKMQKHLEAPLIKYCLYYGSSNDNMENKLWADYERHWLYASIETKGKAFQHEVKDMILNGISEEWIDSFGIPRSLVGIFFNRYCHWVGLYDKNDFMEWFEGIRVV